MSEPAQTWGVDSYHVNVGTGDCSVHVLVYQPGAPDKKDRKACRCVLIDGGSVRNKLNPKTGIEDEPVQRTVRWLTNRYSWDDDQCRFDSIVISHWDEDHYAGVLQAIQKDSATGNVPYIKYAQTAQGLEPATYLYCPNWTDMDKLKLNPAPSGWVGQKDGLVYINRLYTGIRGQTPAKADWVSFCRLRTAEESLQNVLGVEFFSNSKCSLNPASVTNLDTLVRNNPPVPPCAGLPNPQSPPPQMLCLSVQNFVLGGRLRVVTEPLTKTNRYSIVCIIYWSDTKRISHYLAGDLNQVTEGKILKWIKDNDSRNCRMTSVKLSHHGARSSTPLNMTLDTMPVNMLISNPSAGHVHPGKLLSYRMDHRLRLPDAVSSMGNRFLSVALCKALASARWPTSASLGHKIPSLLRLQAISNVLDRSCGRAAHSLPSTHIQRIRQRRGNICRVLEVDGGQVELDQLIIARRLLPSVRV